MEIYILDSQTLRRDSVVESYDSMIWTERFNAFGDFQLDISPDKASVPLITQGTFLAIDKSDRIMYIDSVESTDKEDGTRSLIIKGKSLEKILDERLNCELAYLTLYGSSGTGTDTYTLGPATPSNLIYTNVNYAIRTNAYVTDDIIPFIQPGTYSAAGDIALPAGNISIQTQFGSLYEMVKNIAQMYNIGFRIIRVERAAATPYVDLYFEVYGGFNRTTGQSTNPPVVFSHELDNLTDTTELTLSDGHKNVAYVFAPNGCRIVFSEDPSVWGFERKVMVVLATDITTASGTTLDNQLEQRGQEELAKTRVIVGFDGQIAQTSKYVYNTNYMLGDLVEQRSEHGMVKRMRVTEQIMISDKDGDKSYPTLVLDSLVSAGSWDSIAPDKTWDSYTTETWDSM